MESIFKKKKDNMKEEARLLIKKETGEGSILMLMGAG
jgi:hypothetical protein